MFSGQINKKNNNNKIKNIEFQNENLIPTVKLGGGSIMVCGHFAASDTVRLAIIDVPMNSGLYQHILQENVMVSICEPNLNRKLRCSKNPKHRSKYT